MLTGIDNLLINTYGELMSEIGDNISFKDGNGKEFELNQKFVGLKTRENGVLTVNFRTPNDLISDVMSFFESLKNYESVIINIGGTGDIQCYFMGISPLLNQSDKAGFEYSFVSVTLQELKSSEPEEPPHCGI